MIVRFIYSTPHNKTYSTIHGDLTESLAFTPAEYYISERLIIKVSRVLFSASNDHAIVSDSVVAFRMSSKLVSAIEMSSESMHGSVHSPAALTKGSKHMLCRSSR